MSARGSDKIRNIMPQPSSKGDDPSNHFTAVALAALGGALMTAMVLLAAVLVPPEPAGMSERGPLLPFPLDFREVINADTAVYDSPKRTRNLISRLDSQTRVQVVDTVGDWTLIRWDDNRLGYVRSDSLSRHKP